MCRSVRIDSWWRKPFRASAGSLFSHTIVCEGNNRTVFYSRAVALSSFIICLLCCCLGLSMPDLCHNSVLLTALKSLQKVFCSSFLLLHWLPASDAFMRGRLFSFNPIKRVREEMLIFLGVCLSIHPSIHYYRWSIYPPLLWRLLIHWCRRPMKFWNDSLI